MPSAVPVTGESYCGCDSQAESGYGPRIRGFYRAKDCRCGEEEQGGPQGHASSREPLLRPYPNPTADL